MSWEEIELLFSKLLSQIQQKHGIQLSVVLFCDWGGAYPKVRDFAQTDGDCINLSPKIIGEPRHRVCALLMHELGHVLLMRDGDYTHSERYADEIAELCFGVPIYYDKEGVQTLNTGIRPRPNHLPQ